MKIDRSGLYCLAAGVSLLAAVGPVSGQAKGYALRSNRVEVRTQAHWQNWKFPTDIVAISPDGEVAPRFIRDSLNAVLDAGQYTYEISPKFQPQYANSFQANRKAWTRGGIKLAGSRPDLAERAIDGDPTTFWEPDLADSLDNWWLEVDLGRLVSATRVILRFAEDEPGARADPFLQFRVYSATGLNPFGQQDQSGALDYVLVGGTTQPNTDQRLFEFELTPSGKCSEEWTGNLVQYLRIVATASRKNRAELVSEEEYRSLLPADRGAVEYLWRIAGEERLVTPERYATLPEEQRGGVRYFRRERPKLAEVEVWTVGENIALRLLERGGSLHDVNPNSFPERAFDGDMRTDWFGLVYRTTGETAEWGLLTVDLGAQFWVNAIRLLSRVPKGGGGENLLFGYLLRGSDGSHAPDGSLIWSELSSEERQLNLDTRLFEDRFDLRKLRYLEFRNLDIARRTRAYLGDRVQSVVTEIQVYGLGYPPALVLVSDLIDLGTAKNLTTITWEAETPPATAVEIRTRTGNELRQIKHYFKSDGNEVATREEYDKLPSFFKGPIVDEILPGQDWSNWSQAYEKSGERVRSPSPRRYLLIEARLLSDDPQARAILRSIQVYFTNPVAERVVGEIEPKQEVLAGESTDFDLFIRPEFGSAMPGIDRFRLVGPSQTVLELRRVSLGDEAGFLAGMTEDFASQGEGRFANAAGEFLGVNRLLDTLEIQLPRPLRQGGAPLVRLSFRAQVYQSGSTFQVEVGNSRYPEIWQRVDPGEAVGDALSPGSGLTVMTPVSSQTLKLIAVQPRICTPNGDGRNEKIVFEFAVLKVNAARQVSVELFDLSGNLLCRLVETRPTASGLYRMAWDGRDQGGGLVPPGVYLADIRIDSDRGGYNAAKVVVGVAY